MTPTTIAKCIKDVRLTVLVAVGTESARVPLILGVKMAALELAAHMAKTHHNFDYEGFMSDCGFTRVNGDWH